MKRQRKEKITPQYLEKRKVPKVLIAGLIMAGVLGWTGWTKLDNIKNYYQIKQVFPTKTRAAEVLDGDTFTISNGLTLRLLGVDAPGRGEEKYREAKEYLRFLVVNKPLTLEYDHYQDDKFGRILAYVFIACFQEIQRYCRGDRALVNEMIVKEGFAKKVMYEKRKKLKYDEYFND